jgi:hypothetical protein
LTLSDKVTKFEIVRRIANKETVTIAMIINALDFTNRRLYLTPQFYQSKAVCIVPLK